MSRKHKARELAMKLLYLWDMHGTADDSMTCAVLQEGGDVEELRQAARAAAEGAWNQRESIDAWVERLAPQWPPRRQPAVDRAVLRLAVWELTNSDTPPKVVIDEAIELAKGFSTEQSAAFVNGVLDAVLKEHQRLIAPSGAGVSPASPNADEASALPGNTDESVRAPDKQN